ncbi:LrgB family protein, partial [Cobetia marina]
MNLAPLDALWVYLSASPLLHLLLTLAAFLLATVINRLARGASLAHPVLVSIALIIGFLWLTDTDYATYFEGAQFIHFLLGPATVALAVPLFDHLDRVKQMLWPLLTACCVGITTAVTTTLGLALVLGAHTPVALSLAPKLVTSPIAMGIAEKLGGIPSLTAGLVLLTGTLGCVIGPLMLRLSGARDDTVKGFTMGLS